MTGVAKGAGMIHPNMATMLSVLTTDFGISPACLKEAVKYAADRSFNSISIDGDTSTNDTFAVLANGLYGGPRIESTSSKEYEYFRQCLTDAAIELSNLIVKDGEGVTKFVTITVEVGNLCSALLSFWLMGMSHKPGRPDLRRGQDSGFFHLQVHLGEDRLLWAGR